jgi:transposase
MLSDTHLPAAAEPNWAAFAAIDWADQKHSWKLLMADSRHTEQGELENTPEAIEAWASELLTRFGGRPIALCLEQSRGSLVYLLARHAHIELFLVHPKTAADYRKTFTPSQAKSDPADCTFLLDLLLRHRERLHRWQPDTVETRLLQLLVEQRRRLVDEKTRQKNRLKSCLKLYFPQLLSWFAEIDTPLVAAFLQRWPHLAELQRARADTLRHFFQQHNVRRESLIEERLQAIAKAVPVTADPAILEAGALQAAALLALLQTVRDHIAKLDDRIAQVFPQHPEAGLFQSLPGAGAALAPRLLVAFGTNRERFRTAYDLECLSGIAPVTEASGRSCWVHFRWACPKFLRQTFHEFASHSIRSSEWARAFYERQIQNHKSHHAAIRALAFKWIRILFRCWKQKQPYNEQTYLQALHKRQSPLGKAFTFTTGFGWTSVAGFHKLSRKTS